MPKISYEDYEYVSEEEKNQDKRNQRSTDYSEDEGSNSAPKEGSSLDDVADVDEYAAFGTDLEKYMYDLEKWNGVQNTRKYVKKKKNEGEDQENGEYDGEEETKRTNKSATVPVSKEGEIKFDTAGNLWFEYHKDKIFIAERATFHHWIRAGLIQMEDSTGTYDFARKRGPGNFDVTCFSKVQQHWGLQRPHYAPIMFEWERLDRKDPNYHLGSLYHEGLLVLDYWRSPVRYFHEIPLVISSAFEGGFMEPATRLHSEMSYEDIRARMPPFVETMKNGILIAKALSKSSTFSGRSRHFREDAGAISWSQREGSDKIKAFIENIVKPLNNSTRWSRDLTKDEVKRLRLMNHGTKPGRAKPGTTKKSKEKYIANTREAAGLTSETAPSPNVEDEDDNEQELETNDEEMTEAEDDDYQEPTDAGWEISYEDGYDQLFGDQDDQFLGGLLGPSEDINIPATPRMLFNCMTPPHLRAMTEEEAYNDPTVDHMDPRNFVPKLSVEVTAIRDALKVTIDHFKAIFGFEPIVSEGSNYNSEYCGIQDQMDEMVGDDATALHRLKRWEGTVFDWEQAEVEEDPCFGRRRPPFF